MTITIVQKSEIVVKVDRRWFNKQNLWLVLSKNIFGIKNFFRAQKNTDSVQSMVNKNNLSTKSVQT